MNKSFSLFTPRILGTSPIEAGELTYSQNPPAFFIRARQTTQFEANTIKAYTNEIQWRYALVGLFPPQSLRAQAKCVGRILSLLVRLSEFGFWFPRNLELDERPWFILFPLIGKHLTPEKIEVYITLTARR